MIGIAPLFGKGKLKVLRGMVAITLLLGNSKGNEAISIVNSRGFVVHDAS